jgi:hypothetical protein
VEEYLVCNLKVGGSRPAVLKLFSKTPPENSGGPENSAETAGTSGINFFCYMYESSLRHPVWVPEINVKPCNSAWAYFPALFSASKSMPRP